MKLEPVWINILEYCNPRKNVTILRHRFFTCEQLEGQSFHGFITELKNFSAECEFENLPDSLIKDVIFCGTNENAFLERLLRESDLTLSRAISAGHAAEETRKHACEILQFQSAAEFYKINKLHKPLTKLPTKNQMRLLRNANFAMAPIP